MTNKHANNSTIQRFNEIIHFAWKIKASQIPVLRVKMHRMTILSPIYEKCNVCRVVVVLLSCSKLNSNMLNSIFKQRFNPACSWIGEPFVLPYQMVYFCFSCGTLLRLHNCSFFYILSKELRKCLLAKVHGIVCITDVSNPHIEEAPSNIYLFDGNVFV